MLYDDLETEDFPIWYANKLIQTPGLTPTGIVDKVAALLGRLEREYEVDRYINLLHDVINGKSMWRKAIYAAQITPQYGATSIRQAITRRAMGISSGIEQGQHKLLLDSIFVTNI